MFPEHFFAVRASVEPGREAEFNRWYDEEHVPDFLELVPACLGAARYRVVDGDGSHQYLAVYAFPSEAALREFMASEGLRELVRRYDQAIGSFSTRSRATYTRILEVMSDE
jgi:antibiotic biosynthesis monooxygenase (ABM) superfamily enzyme